MTVTPITGRVYPGRESHGTYVPGTPGWYQFRQNKIGGSDIGAICGLSQWATLYTTYWAKKGVIDDQDKPELEWGNRLESAVLRKFWDDHPDRAIAWGLEGAHTRLDRPWQLATPDGIYARDGMIAGVVEAKTSRNGDGFGRSGTDEVPPSYLAQVLWNADVMGVEEASLACLIGGSDYREFRFENISITYADDLAFLLEQGQAFMRRLEIDDEPRPDDGSDVTYQLVRKQHPDIDRGEWYEADLDQSGRFVDAVLNWKRTERDYTRERTLLLDAMGRAQYAGVTDRTGITTKIASRTAKTTREGNPGTPYLEPARNLERLFG